MRVSRSCSFLDWFSTNYVESRLRNGDTCCISIIKLLYWHKTLVDQQATRESFLSMLKTIPTIQASRVDWPNSDSNSISSPDIILSTDVITTDSNGLSSKKILMSVSQLELDARYRTLNPTHSFILFGSFLFFPNAYIKPSFSYRQQLRQFFIRLALSLI